MRLKLSRIIELAIAVVLVLAAIYFLPKLIHTCDRCDKFFIGTGFEANIVSDAFSTVTGNESDVLCKECAKTEHALAIATGKSVNDFRLPLFE